MNIVLDCLRQKHLVLPLKIYGFERFLLYTKINWPFYTLNYYLVIILKEKPNNLLDWIMTVLFIWILAVGWVWKHQRKKRLLAQVTVYTSSCQ